MAKKDECQNCRLLNSANAQLNKKLGELTVAYIALREAQIKTDEWKQTDVFRLQDITDDLAGFDGTG